MTLIRHWLLLQLLMMVVVMPGAVAGWGRRRMRGMRGCRRAMATQTEQETGLRYSWNMTGLDLDNLRVTYAEGATAAEGDSTVVKSALSGGQRALGLVAGTVLYDFTGPDKPVIVIRSKVRRRAFCVVVDAAVDMIDTYDQLISDLNRRNGSSNTVPEEQGARLVAMETSDGLQMSEAAENFCSRDMCGRSVSPLFFTTQQEEGDETTDGEDANEDDEDDADDDDTAMTDSSFALFNTRVAVSGLPNHHPGCHGRHQRRQQGVWETLRQAGRQQGVWQALRQARRQPGGQRMWRQMRRQFGNWQARRQQRRQQRRGEAREAR